MFDTVGDGAGLRARARSSFGNASLLQAFDEDFPVGEWLQVVTQHAEPERRSDAVADSEAYSAVASKEWRVTPSANLTASLFFVACIL
jgi:hypothetical protein